jgi:hypothetical protein
VDLVPATVRRKLAVAVPLFQNFLNSCARFICNILIGDPISQKFGENLGHTSQWILLLYNLLPNCLIFKIVNSLSPFDLNVRIQVYLYFQLRCLNGAFVFRLRIRPCGIVHRSQYELGAGKGSWCAFRLRQRLEQQIAL